MCAARPPRRLRVRLREPLQLGGRVLPKGEEVRLPVDLACMLWARRRVDLLERAALRQFHL